MSNHSITVLITAYNEEKTIADAVYHTGKALQKYTQDYEIIVFDDGSKDDTGKIADVLAQNNFRLMVVHNEVNKNLGPNLRAGVALAKKEYIMAFVNADTYPTEEAFQGIFSAIGKKELILGYSVDYGDRPWPRRFLSWAFVKIMNFLFGFHIRYYNGPIIVKSAAWRTVPMTTDSFAYMAEVTATLLKRGASYEEVPMFYTPELKGLNVSVLRRNIMGVIKALASLFWRLNIKQEFYKNNKKI